MLISCNCREIKQGWSKRVRTAHTPGALCSVMSCCVELLSMRMTDLIEHDLRLPHAIILRGVRLQPSAGLGRRPSAAVRNRLQSVYNENLPGGLGLGLAGHQYVAHVHRYSRMYIQRCQPTSVVCRLQCCKRHVRTRRTSRQWNHDDHVDCDRVPRLRAKQALQIPLRYRRKDDTIARPACCRFVTIMSCRVP